MIIKCAVDFVSFFYIIDNRVANKLIFTLTIHRFIKSLLMPLPPTPRPHCICTGSGVSIKTMPLEGTHNDGDDCGVCSDFAFVLVST